MITKISTVNMTHDDWLQARRHTIGGSDAAAIVGLSDYASPFTVWAEKTGKMPEVQDNEPMRLGRDLENYVAERFTEKTGKKVRRDNNIIKNDLYPFAHANVDRMIVGEDAGLECKTTNAFSLKKFKNGEFPANYYVQCMHYMAVTGLSKWYLAVLVLGVDFKVFEINRDDGEIKALMDSEADFMECVVSNTPPSMMGIEREGEALGTIYADGTALKTVDLTPFSAEIQTIINLQKQTKELTTEIDLHKNNIKAYLQDAETGTSPAAKITWKSQSKKNFDDKAFVADNPNMDLSKYCGITISRVFRITEGK